MRNSGLRNGNQRQRKEKKKHRFRDVHGLGVWEMRGDPKWWCSIKASIRIFAALSYCISVTETLKQTDRDMWKLNGSTYVFFHCRSFFFFFVVCLMI